MSQHDEFATVLKEQIIKRKQTRRSKRLLEIIDARPSRHRTRVLERLARHAQSYLYGVGVFTDVNSSELAWTEVKERDWEKFFEGLIKLLTAILPMILQFI